MEGRWGDGSGFQEGGGVREGYTGGGFGVIEGVEGEVVLLGDLRRQVGYVVFYGIGGGANVDAVVDGDHGAFCGE